MKMLNFKHQKQRLTFWFLVITIIPLMVTFGFSYFHLRKQIKQQEIEKLLAVRDLKVKEINDWIEHIEADVSMLSRNSRIHEWGQALTNNSSASVIKDKQAYVEYVFNYWIEENQYAKEIFVADATSGSILLSTNHSNEGSKINTEDYFNTCLNERHSSIKDIYKAKENGAPEMLFAGPVIDPDSKEVICVVAIKINLNASLYELMLNRTGMGKTGETLIVNEDVYTLSELRWYNDAPLNLKIEANPAVKSSQGITGIEKTKDYRGIEIYAAYTHIDKTNWGFVAKRDVKELNTPVNNFTVSFLFILFASIVVLIIISRIIAQSISNPITNISRIAEEFKEGNYKLRTQVTSTDEIGDLASSVNEMADTLEKHAYVQKGRQKISDSLISVSNIDKFWETISKHFMTIADANTCACYILDNETDVFRHEYSIGLNKEMMTSFSANELEGELGLVLTSKTLIHKTRVNKDTLIKLKTTVSDFIPEELISFPILHDNAVYAIISLAKDGKFSTEVTDIINQTSVTLNAALTNILSTTTTELLAKELTHTNKVLKDQQLVTQQQNDELQRQRDVLNSQAQELKRQNAELEQQRNHVEEATRMKSEFLSNMSHELRTPLNSVMALSRVLLMQAQGKLSDEEISYLEIIERNGKNLLALINSILDLSKIEAGKIEIAISKFNINNTIQIITENLSQLARDKGLEIRFDLDDRISMIESDENKIIQIIQNIIGNAFKFTEEGHISIKTQLKDNHVRLAIKDTGIGISKKALLHIFEEFRQADGSTSRKYEGSGLGLSISKRLVDLLKGKICVQSKVGEGSEFEIILPLTWGDEEVLISQEPSRDTDYSSKKTVLVVDDEPEISISIATNIEKAGYATYQLNQGTKVVETAKQIQPFAITLDLLMPDMDGYEVLQELKQDPETANIPVIVVSISKDKDTALALGAVGYISKPVVKDELVKEIKRISTSPLNVLVVEDNEFERKNVVKFLEEDNYLVTDAEDGIKCLELLDKILPDVVILDLMMPGLDGFSVIEKIKQNPETASIPVIITTAKDLSTGERNSLEELSFSILEKNYSTANSSLKRIVEELQKLDNKPVPQAITGKKQILIVEDNNAAIIQLQKVLEREGYIIHIAKGGQEAIDFVGHTIPDGIILDLMMPEIDGFQVLENIRSTDETRHIPVLILTAKNLTKEDLQVLSSNHIQQLIQKGDVNEQELIFKVELMLGNKPANRIKQPVRKTVELPTKAVGKPQYSGSGTHKILVIEDNHDNLTTISAILKPKYRLILAENGKLGIDNAFNSDPDLILLDMMLPEMNGLEVLDVLRKDTRTLSIPVIALTAQAMKGDKERFLAAGCDDYMSKPIDPLNLLDIISKWLSSKN
ncbi:response regulator [Puteibacter caeruleilacunae]|nr:response regulator [Puteibacter caeruleilacunae]